MALSEADRIKLLEELAANEDLKATQRLRALEELGRIEARKSGAAAAAATTPVDEDAPDPMADLDELEQRRLARKSKRAAAG